MRSSLEATSSIGVMLLLLAAVLAVIFVLDRLLTPQRFSNEPPVVSQLVPYIGHLLGLLRHGSKYYQITR